MAAATPLLDKKQLRTLVPLNGLSAPHFEEVAKKGVIEQLPAGRVLFKKGTRDGVSIFLLEGEVALLDGKDVKTVVRAGTEEARHALAPQQPRQFTGRVASRATILKIDSGLLDVLLAWDQSNSYEVTEIQSEDDEDWMTRMLQSDLFLRLPATNIQQMIMRMEELDVKAGDVVVRQDEEGDYYYIIKQGVAAVTRTPSPSSRPVKVAELHNGDSFGEEALVSGGRRNATVTMLTDGNLMRLSKSDFDALLGTPLIKKLNYDEAKKLVSKGALWLDVRLPGEYQNAHLPHSVNVPLAAVRDASAELDTDRTYVVCCDTATRSAGAAFLLNQRGLDAFVLDQGLGSVPHADLESPGGGESGGAEIIEFQSGRPAPKEADAAESADGAAAGEELARLRAELEDAREQLTELERAIASKRKELKAAGAEAGASRELQKEIERSLSEAEAARKRAETLDRELKEARRAQQSLDERLEQTAETLENTKSSLEEVQAEKERNESELEQARTALEESRRAVQEYQAKLEALEQDHSRGAEEIRKRVAELEQEVADREAARATLEQELRDAHGQAMAEAESKLSELEAAGQKLQAERDELAGARSKLEEELNALRAGQGDLERSTAQRIEDLEQERAELQKQLEDRTQAHESLRSELAGLQQARQELEHSHALRLEELEQARAALQEELAQQSQSHRKAEAGFEQQRQELERSLAELQQELESLRKARDEVEGEAGERIRSLEQERDRLADEATRQADSLQALEADKEKLDAQLAEQVRSRGELESELGALKSERERLDDELQGLRTAREAVEGEAGDRIRELEQERDRIAAELSERAERVQALEADKEGLDAQLAEQVRSRGELESELQALKSERERLNEELQGLRTAREAVEGEAGDRIRELEQERDRIAAELSDRAERVQALEAEVERLGTELGGAAESKARLESELAELTSERDRLDSERERVAAELKEQSELRARLEGEVNELKSGQEHLQRERTEVAEHLERELSALREALDVAEEAKSELAARLETAAAEAEQTGRTAEARIAELEAELSSARAAAADERAELQSQLETLSGGADKTAEEYSARLAELEGAHAEALQAQAGKLEAIAEELEAERSARATAEASLEDARAALEDSGRAVDARIVELQEQVKALEAARDDARQSATSLEAEQAQRVGEIDKLRSEREGLAQRVAELEQQMREAVEERDRAHMKAADARKAAEEADSRRIDLEASFQAMEGEVETQRGDLKKLELSRERWGSERADFEAGIGELQQEIQALTQRQTESAERAEDARREAEQLRSEVETLTHALEHQAPEEVGAEIASIRELADRELEEAAGQLTTMRQDLAAANQRAASAEAHGKELSQALAAAERRLQSLESELAMSRHVAAAPMDADMQGASAAGPNVDHEAVARLEQENTDLREQILRIQREQEAARARSASAAAGRGADIFDLNGADDAMFSAPEQNGRGGKGMIIGVVALVLLVIGAGGYWWYSGATKSAAPTASGEPKTAKPVPAPAPQAAPAPAKPASAPVVAAAAPAIRAGRTYQDFLKDGGIGPVMIEVPAGSFAMGTGPGFPYFDERPRHQVSLKGFSISKNEVTFEDYDRFATATGRAKPSDEGWGRGRRPVINVSWNDAEAYAAWLSQQTGHHYRLASESEWEYAARAGTDTNYWWGNEPGKGRADCLNCGSKWDGVETGPVGSFASNPLGLNDTAGNVMEWVQDCYHQNYDGAPTDGSAWVGGNCSERVVRGGSYRTPVDNLRSTKRYHFSPAVRGDYIGFRVVRDK